MKSFKQYLYELEAGEKFDPHLAYNDTLNPAIWENGNSNPDKDESIEWSLRSEVQIALSKIANEFIQFLNINSSSVTDVIFTGSNANYNWTDISDIDLHLIVDMSNGQICPTCPSDDFITDCFQAKKNLWNSTHNITIHGYDVELYAQDALQSIVQDAGVYSLKNNSWLQRPEHKQITIDNNSVKLKSQDIMHQIDSLIDSQGDDLDDLNDIKDRIKKLRTAGLQKGGEFSIENLAFKALRNMGYLDKLSNYIKNLKDQDLSI